MAYRGEGGGPGGGEGKPVKGPFVKTSPFVKPRPEGGGYFYIFAVHSGHGQGTRLALCQQQTLSYVRGFAIVHVGGARELFNRCSSYPDQVFSTGYRRGPGKHKNTKHCMG